MIHIIYPNGQPEAGKKYRFIKKMITPKELEAHQQIKKENQLIEPIKPEKIIVAPSLGPSSNRIATLETWRRSPEQGSIYKESVVKEDYDPVAHVGGIVDNVGGVIRGGIASAWKGIKNMGKTKAQLQKEALDKETSKVMNDVDDNSSY